MSEEKRGRKKKKKDEEESEVSEPVEILPEHMPMFLTMASAINGSLKLATKVAVEHFSEKSVVLKDEYLEPDESLDMALVEVMRYYMPKMENPLYLYGAVFLGATMKHVKVDFKTSIESETSGHVGSTSNGKNDNDQASSRIEAGKKAENTDRRVAESVS